MSLFANYRASLQAGGYEGAFDEIFADADTLTPHSYNKKLVERLLTLRAEDFKRRVALADTTLMSQGITFTVYGDAAGVERTFPVDLIPRVIPANEWDTIERGLTQRVNALNLFLHDLYHEGHVLKDGVIPSELIDSAAHYRRAFIGCKVPKNIYVHICGTDLVRDGAGNWCVLEDNLRTPSGVSYVLENRLILTRVFPQLFADNAIRPVDHYTTTLLANLRALSPRPQSTVVLLTPGVYNSAYFEHAFLAQQMGIELVQGADLFVGGDDVVYMKTTRGPQRVDVIYRRIDDDFLDPEVFRADSGLGVRGLMRAYAQGNVALANAVGTGVADDKVIYKYVPDLIRYYLNEDAILPNIPTYCAWDDKERDYMLANLDKLVVKSANESGGYGMLIGPQASTGERADFAQRILAAPRNYLAQPVVELSVAPCYIERQGIVPRRVDLRPYVLSGPDGVTIIPGGLTRVALKEGSYVVNSSQGGGSKDTWVLAPQSVRRQSQRQSQSGGGSQSQSQSQGQKPATQGAILARQFQSQLQSGTGGFQSQDQSQGDAPPVLPLAPGKEA